MKNNNLNWYVGVQTFTETGWGRSLSFVKILPKNEYGLYEPNLYAEHATKFVSYEEAQMYSFALNFNQNREYSKDYFFPIQIDSEGLPHIRTEKEIEKDEKEEK